MASELERAIRRKDIDAVKQSLDQTPALVNEKLGDEPGSRKPIWEAIYSGNPNMVELLLDRGANVNEEENDTGEIPLHTAVTRGDPQMVELLLKRGADPTRKRRGNVTPIFGVGLRHYGQRDLSSKEIATAKRNLELLISHGGNTLLDAKDVSKKTPLDFLTPELKDYALKLAEKFDVFKTKSLPSLATLSVASAKPGSKIPPLPHEVVGQVIRPFLDPQGKPTKKLFPTYSEATKSGIVQRAAEQEDQEALAAMKTGGRRKTRMRKTKKRRTLRKHKWRTG